MQTADTAYILFLTLFLGWFGNQTYAVQASDPSTIGMLGATLVPAFAGAVLGFGVSESHQNPQNNTRSNGSNQNGDVTEDAALATAIAYDDDDSNDFDI